jgi:hypothetical protein
MQDPSIIGYFHPFIVLYTIISLPEMTAMKKLLLLWAVCAPFLVKAQPETDLRNAIRTIASTLEKNVPSAGNVAILPFYTQTGTVTPFSAFILDELALAWQQHRNIKVMDPSVVASKLAGYGYNATMTRSFEHFEKIAYELFMELGASPEYFIYGEINDLGETITITGHLIPNGLKSAGFSHAVRIQSSVITDKLLGKPIRKQIFETAPSATATPVSGNWPFVEDEGFRFQITGTSWQSENRLLVEVSVTNLGNTDREFNLLPDASKAFDNNGNEYIAVKRYVANKEADGYQNLQHRYIPGIKTQVKLLFNNVDRSTSAISLLQIAIFEPSKGHRTTSIRNIPVK